jgi:hypothetical protein
MEITTAVRPTYAERRMAQFTSGEATPIPPKPKKPKPLRRQWVPCCAEVFVDGEGGPTRVRWGTKQPSAFWSEEEACAAEQEFFKANGFHEAVVQCEVCSKHGCRRMVWHVRHVFNSEIVRMKAAATGWLGLRHCI